MKNKVGNFNKNTIDILATFRALGSDSLYPPALTNYTQSLTFDVIPVKFNFIGELINSIALGTKELISVTLTQISH